MSRTWGPGVIVTLDAKGKPTFRHADLSPREELAEAKAELARLEGYDWEETLETKQCFPDRGSVARIQELKRKIASIDYWFNDSAPRPHIATPADLNRYHAEFYKQAPPSAKVVTVADINKRNAERYGQ